MTTEEEIRLKLGYDAKAVIRGTQAMMDSQKKAAMDYKNFWLKSINEVEQAEIAADVRAASRANKAAALRRQRAGTLAERQARDFAEIEAGYVPANMQSGGKSKLGRAGNAAGNAAGQVAALSGSEKALEVVQTVGAFASIGLLLKKIIGIEFVKEFAHAGHALKKFGGRLIEHAGLIGRAISIVGGVAGAYYAVRATMAERAYFKAVEQQKTSEARVDSVAKDLGKRLGLGDNATMRDVEKKQKELFQQREAAERKSIEQHDEGKLIGGAAYEDRQRQVAYHNKLAGAGLETPAMQMADMRESLNNLDTNMADLARRARSDGLKIADED